MKSLQSLESADEKLSALCKKYAELSEEHRTSQASLKQTQRTLSVVSGPIALPTVVHLDIAFERGEVMLPRVWSGFVE